MQELFGIWVYLAEQPLLWLTVTVGIYAVAHRLFLASGEFALLNPVLISVASIVGLLLITETPYRAYFNGAQFIHFMLGPATVLLALPLYAQAKQLRKQWLPLAVALFFGSVTAILAAVALGWMLGLDRELLVSLMPKSATIPIAMATSEKLGGEPSLTAVFVIFTGITGAVAGVPLMRLFGERSGDIKGFALGVVAHGIATARAFQHSDKAGAYAGLGMGLNAALTALLVPLIAWLLGLY